MAIITKLVGGSASMYTNNNYENQNRLTLFHNNVPNMHLNARSAITGYILPAFDSNMHPNDNAFATSYEPYRMQGIVDRNDPMHFAMSSWFFKLTGYIFFGRGKHSFVSPSLFGEADPIVDLRIHAYNLRNKHGDNSMLRYVRTDAMTDEDKKVFREAWQIEPYLSNPRDYHIVNVYSTGGGEDNEMKNRILILKPGAFKQLLRDLNAERPARMQNILDPDWDNYTLGDVTNPERACAFHIGTTALETNPNRPFPVLKFFSAGNTVKQEAIPSNVLAGRFVLNDDTVLRIPTYDEIVEMLVSEKVIPYDVLQEVCAPKCNHFPERPSGDSTTKHSTVSVVTPAPAPAPAPVAPAPAPAPVAPAPAPAQVHQSINSLFDEDPDDDIPMGDEPAKVEHDYKEYLQRLRDRKTLTDEEKAALQEFRANNTAEFERLVAGIKANSK